MLVGVDLKNIDLWWIELSDVNLVRVNFSGCDLVKVNFFCIILYEVSLVGVDLRGVRFFYGIVEYVIFCSCIYIFNY